MVRGGEPPVRRTGPRSRWFARGLAAVAPATVLVLAGCTASDSPTADEARTEFLAALDDTQAMLGGTWDNRDDPTPRGCLLSLWADGIQYPALRIGPDPHSVESTVRAVETLWEEWGYRTERTSIGAAVEVQGSDDGALLVFRASTQGMTLQGESSCRPD